jgi:hypothetical protein
MRNEGKRDRKGKDVPKPTNKQEKNKKGQKEKPAVGSDIKTIS